MVKSNGIYELAKDVSFPRLQTTADHFILCNCLSLQGKTVDCIHYLPDDQLLSRLNEAEEDEKLYNLVTMATTL